MTRFTTRRISIGALVVAAAVGAGVVGLRAATPSGNVHLQGNQIATGQAPPGAAVSPQAAAAEPPVGCGPQHPNGPYSAAACVTVHATDTDHHPLAYFPDAYITTPPSTSCKIVFKLYQFDGSDYANDFYGNAFGSELSDTQDCRAGNNVHYVPGPALQNIDPNEQGQQQMRLVVDVIDQGLTKVIADSPVQSANGITHPATPASGQDTVSTTGPGDGTADKPTVWCVSPLPIQTGPGVTLKVSAQAHRNGDGTVASISDFNATIGGAHILASVEPSTLQGSALITNGGHAAEIHVTATVLYGVQLGNLGSSVGVNCTSFYSF